MNGKNPFLILKMNCPDAIEWASDHLQQAGLQLVQTFSLQAARAANNLCSCPHHGTDQCDCQMVVLLVYENNYPPVSLVTHTQDGKTWFTLVDSAQQRVDAYLERVILECLAPNPFFHQLEDRPQPY